MFLAFSYNVPIIFLYFCPKIFILAPGGQHSASLTTQRLSDNSQAPATQGLTDRGLRKKSSKGAWGSKGAL